MAVKTSTNCTVFKMRLAGYLMQRGFVLVDIGTNRNNPNKLVFYFKNSDELHSAIKDYNEIEQMQQAQ